MDLKYCDWLTNVEYRIEINPKRVVYSNQLEIELFTQTQVQDIPSAFIYLYREKYPYHLPSLYKYVSLSLLNNKMPKNEYTQVEMTLEEISSIHQSFFYLYDVVKRSNLDFH